MGEQFLAETRVYLGGAETGNWRSSATVVLSSAGISVTDLGDGATLDGHLAGLHQRHALLFVVRSDRSGGPAALNAAMIIGQGRDFYLVIQDQEGVDHFGELRRHLMELAERYGVPVFRSVEGACRAIIEEKD